MDGFIEGVFAVGLGFGFAVVLVLRLKKSDELALGFALGFAAGFLLLDELGFFQLEETDL
ncbi:MAG: hypothetical protein ACPGN3_08980 [Opitutales bacterium]